MPFSATFEEGEMMPIPRSFTEKYLKKSKDCRFFGVPIEELTRDELIACAVAGWEKESEARAEGLRMVDFMRGFYR